MINPVDSNFDTKLVEKISSKRIIEKYKAEFNVDVTKYFKDLEFVEIHECQITKYRFFYPFSIIGDGEFYINLSNGKGNYYHERWEHKIALKQARRAEKWLEVGSGNSHFLKELSKIGVSAMGLELNSKEVLRAKSEIFEVRDCDFFAFDYDKGAYDTIALFQVLEHIKDISTFFGHAKELLKSKGKLIIAVPNNNPYLYVFDKYHTLNLPPHHMGLWTGHSLKKVGASFGFSVIDLQFEPISQQELGYILNLSAGDDFSLANLKFLVLKGIRKFFPKRLFHFVSSIYRKYLINGRNILIVLEKND